MKQIEGFQMAMTALCHQQIDAVRAIAKDYGLDGEKEALAIAAKEFFDLAAIMAINAGLTVEEVSDHAVESVTTAANVHAGFAVLVIAEPRQ